MIYNIEIKKKNKNKNKIKASSTPVIINIKNSRKQSWEIKHGISRLSHNCDFSDAVICDKFVITNFWTCSKFYK